MAMDPTIPISKMTDSPGEDETAEVAGHRFRRFGAEQATEQPTDDPEAEVEGHAIKRP